MWWVDSRFSVESETKNQLSNVDYLLRFHAQEIKILPSDIPSQCWFDNRSRRFTTVGRKTMCRLIVNQLFESPVSTSPSGNWKRMVVNLCSTLACNLTSFRFALDLCYLLLPIYLVCYLHWQFGLTKVS